MRHIRLEHERFVWDKAERLFGAGSSASPEERGIVERLMRKRILKNLESMDCFDMEDERSKGEKESVRTACGTAETDSTTCLPIDGTAATRFIERIVGPADGASSVKPDERKDAGEASAEVEEVVRAEVR